MWYASEIHVWLYRILGGLSGSFNIFRSNSLTFTDLLLHFEKDICSFSGHVGAPISSQMCKSLFFFYSFLYIRCFKWNLHFKLDLTSKTLIPLFFLALSIFPFFLNGSEYNQNSVSGDLILAVFNLQIYYF